MIREETSARTRLAVAGRSRSDRGEQLCAASPDCGRPACSTDRRSASRLPASGVLHSCKSRRRRCRSVARSSRILWFASSAGFARRCSAGTCGSRTGSKSPITAPPLATADGSSIDRARLFGAALEDGEADRFGAQTGYRGGAPANRRSTPQAAHRARRIAIPASARSLSF